MKIGNLRELNPRSNSSGSSGGSSQIVELPNAINGLYSKKIGIDSLHFNWIKSNNAEGYKLLYKKNTIPTISDLNNGIILDKDTSDYTLNSLNSGDTYGVWVVSLDANGNVQTCKNTNNTLMAVVNSLGTSANLIELSYPTELANTSSRIIRCGDDGKTFISAFSGVNGLWMLQDDFTWLKIDDSTHAYNGVVKDETNHCYYIGNDSCYLFIYNYVSGEVTRIINKSYYNYVNPWFMYQGVLIYSDNHCVNYFNPITKEMILIETNGMSYEIYYNSYAKTIDNRFFFLSNSSYFIYWDGVIGDKGMFISCGFSPIAMYKDSKDRVFFHQTSSSNYHQIYMWNQENINIQLVYDDEGYDFDDWFETSNGDLYSYAKYYEVLIKFNETTKMFEKHTIPKYNYLFKNRNDEIFLFDFNINFGYMAKINTNDYTYATHIYCSNGNTKICTINYVYEDLEGNLWMSSSSSNYMGLYKYDGTIVTRVIDNQYNVRCIYEDSDKIIFDEDDLNSTHKQIVYTKATQVISESTLNAGKIVGLVGSPNCIVLSDTNKTISTTINSKNIVGNNYSTSVIKQFNSYYTVMNNTDHKCIINVIPN